MWPIEDVCRTTTLDRATVQQINQLFQLRGQEPWPEGQVADQAILALALQGVLQGMGYKAEHIQSSFTYFIDDLIRLGGLYVGMTLKTPTPITLWQICDNHYVSIVEGHEKLKRVFDLTVGSGVTLSPTPVVILSVVLPKLYWLSVAALRAPSGPHSEAAAEPSGPASLPA